MQIPSPVMSNFPNRAAPLEANPLLPDAQSLGPEKTEAAQVNKADAVSLGEGKDKASTYESLADIAKQQKAQEKSVEAEEKADEEKIQELKDRDQEVRTHEQAHAAVGGQYAGAPSYEFETGPDGNRYAVGGEVSIDVSEEKDPEDTISKMQVVRAAALAPAEPSTQDYKVAAEASQKEQAARADVAKSSVAGEAQEQNQNTDSPSSELKQSYHFAALAQYTRADSPVSTAFSALA